MKSVILQCLTCYRFKAQANQQLIGELTSKRVQTSRPFLPTGVEYAGPISLRLGPPPSKPWQRVTLLCLYDSWLGLLTLKKSQAYPQKHFLLPWNVSLHVERNRGPFGQTMYQLSRCCQRTSRNLQNASIHFTDGNSTGLFGHWRVRMEIYSNTSTSLRRIMGSSIENHEVSSAKNTRFSGCHLRGTVHITCWHRGLSKLQNLVCLIRWSFQTQLTCLLDIF